MEAQSGRGSASGLLSTVSSTAATQLWGVMLWTCLTQQMGMPRREGLYAQPPAQVTQAMGLANVC